MSQKKLRIGTRDSQLAVWQATLVQDLLKEKGVASELVYIKSEGDLDTITPLYELGVQGVFTKALDAALLSKRIDLAVHSMKDVPTQLATGLTQAAVLKRASYKDILVLNPGLHQRENKFIIEFVSIETGGGKKPKDHSWTLPLREDQNNPGKPEKITIATSSVRRIAQWLNQWPDSQIENLRGNVNTRLRKLEESEWHGAIFAAAGLERIGLRPENAIDLDWMLPAPAQGAIMIACRKDDTQAFIPCQSLNDHDTMMCTRVERDFLRTLLGGCSTPISALAEVKGDTLHFRGNIISTDGKQKAETSYHVPLKDAATLGVVAAKQLLEQGGQAIVDEIRQKGLSK
jgi:hydroxymethylbilane synthase